MPDTTPQTPCAPRPLQKGEMYVKVGNFAGMAMLILNAGDYHELGPDGLPLRHLQAGMIGGSAQLYSRERLEALGAFDFREEPTGLHDVKFSISEDTLPDLSRIFSVKRKSKTFECTPGRESVEELAIETFPGRREEPILTRAEAEKIRFVYRGTIMHETKRTEDEGINLHISRVFDPIIPAGIKKKLKKADSVIFTPTTREMKSGEMKRDGSIIALSRKARYIYQYIRGEIALCDVAMVMRRG